MISRSVLYKISFLLHTLEFDNASLFDMQHADIANDLEYICDIHVHCSI